MKGLTHVVFGVGFVSIFLTLLQIPLPLWLLGTFIISPIFSRLPDHDQKIAKITFNQVVPHRGKHSHNLLFILPIFVVFFVTDSPIPVSLTFSVFGAIFAHTLVDAFNSAGVWVGIFKISLSNLSWDSFWGNFLFKIIGIILLLVAVLNYL